VELCVTTEPQQGSCYADVVRFAREVERQGFAGLFPQTNALAERH
jgi:hypothetical protein